MVFNLYKARKILGENITLGTVQEDFLSHNSKFEKVLTELQQRTCELTAKKHLGTWLGSDNVTKEKDFLTFWDKSDRWVLSDINKTSFSSEESYQKFKKISSAVEGKIDVSGIKEAIISNASQVKESFLISKNFFGRLEEHDFFLEMVTRFSSILVEFSGADLTFLVKYATMDESGVLLLFHKILYNVLRCVLASQAIIALYKPGAFVGFLQKAIGCVKPAIGGLPLTNIITVASTTRVKWAGLTTATLGLALYTGVFSKSNAISHGNVALYTGLSGDYGHFLSSFRLLGSQLFFEAAKTLSTFSNAAIAGFLEPKEEAVKSIIKLLKR